MTAATTRAVVLRRKPIPWWKRAGWQCTAPNQYEGWYRTTHGSWKGKVVCRPDGTPRDFYIFNPPRQLRKHPKARCFRYQGNGRCKVHYCSKPKDITGGIMEIQRLLGECFAQASVGGVLKRLFSVRG